MKIIEIAVVSYPVTDLKRARGFYEAALGLCPSRTFGDDQAAWIEYDIGPGTLAISNMVPDWIPAKGGGCAALEVEDFATAVNELKARGVSFVHGPLETPVCHLAVVSDPDGNSLTIHKRKS